MTVKASHQEDLLQQSYAYGASPLTPTSRTSPLKTFLFGDFIAHSLASKVHSALFAGIAHPWSYVLFKSSGASLFLPALKSANIIGCAVAMPYKVSLLSAVDAVTDEARTIGAINTVFLRKNPDNDSTRYIGTDTDTFSIRESFLQSFPRILGQCAARPALVIGGGGAAQSAVLEMARREQGLCRE
jgi:quinate dehydrogenase